MIGLLLLAAGLLVQFSYAVFRSPTLTVDGRVVDAYVPECAHPNSPIIVSLHAWATNKDIQKRVDRLTDYAGPECAVILYPQGLARCEFVGMMGFSWNAGGCCPNANIKHTPDVEFLGHVVTAAAELFKVNENLVFVVGISNGGMMANRFACTNDKVKALVSVSGPLINSTSAASTESFDCSRSVPMLHFHGTEDSIVPYDGCRKGTGQRTCEWMASQNGFPELPWQTVAESIEGWRTRNGIPSGEPGSITFKNGTTSCNSWGSKSNNVSLCTVVGEGHAWPARCDEMVSKLPGMQCSYDIDATQETMDFFRSYIPTTQTATIV